MHKLKSFLGSQAEVRGELSSKGILRLDGRVFGKIFADHVILSETAAVIGEITAEKISIDGVMEGVLHAGDLVEIRSKGKVKGEISAKRFVVMNGGLFDGRITMTTVAHKIVDFEARKASQG